MVTCINDALFPDTGRNVVALTKGTSRTWGAAFTFVREPDGGLTLEGQMEGDEEPLVRALRMPDPDSTPCRPADRTR